MRNYTREELRPLEGRGSPRFDAPTVQEGVVPCPYRVAVASILLNRTRGTQVRPVLRELLHHWPTPAHLARAEGLEDVVRPCGLHITRARQLQRFATMYVSDHWSEFRQLPAVGPYVHDSVGLFCLGLADLETEDHALLSYLARKSQRVRCPYCAARFESSTNVGGTAGCPECGEQQAGYDVRTSGKDASAK